MTNIVQKNANTNRLLLFCGNVVPFSAKLVKCQLREVQRAQGMMETGMVRPRVNVMAHAQLLDAAQALKVTMLYEVVNDFVADGNKSIHGVVKYLSFIDGRLQV